MRAGWSAKTSFLIGLVIVVGADGEEPSKGMIVIPAGEFTMGRTVLTADDKTTMRPQIFLDDLPAHKVWLDAYSIDSQEITQERYAKFLKETGHRIPYHWAGGTFRAGQERYPIFNVSWDDAAAYCKWTGGRLPTEAEWERAARGGKEGLDYPWGNEIQPKDARYNVQSGPGPVGAFAPNEFGLYDMVGGVSEWCSDWFKRTYYEESEPRNPKGPTEGEYKIIRGGAWSDGPRRVTLSFRSWVHPNQRTPNIGFRCASSAPQ